MTSISNGYTLRSLKSSGRHVYAKTDEDGTIEAIFQDIPPKSLFFVEFGIGPRRGDPQYIHGLEGNCVLLREQGWNGIFIDGGEHPAHLGVHREFITALNVNSLFRKYGVPDDVDLVSIDVDGQDFWIWLALEYRPRLLLIEYNSGFQLSDSVTVPFDQSFRWDGTKYHGASLAALVKLGTDKGYKLVHTNGANAFFVRTDLLSNTTEFIDERLFIFVDRHRPDGLQRPWVKI
jgi:hypothetical protein